MSPSLAVPPEPQAALSCLARASRAAASSGRPFTTVTPLPRRPLVSSHTRTAAPFKAAFCARSWARASQRHWSSGWPQPGQRRSAAGVVTRPLRLANWARSASPFFFMAAQASVVVAVLAMHVAVGNLFFAGSPHTCHVQGELQGLAGQRVVAIQVHLRPLDLDHVVDLRLALVVAAFKLATHFHARRELGLGDH